MIVLGSRFSDRVTGKLSDFASHAKVIQVDVDPAEVGKNRLVDAPLYGDVKETLRSILPVLENTIDSALQLQKTADWWGRINQLRANYPLYLDEEAAEISAKAGKGALSPQYVIQRIGEVAKKADPNAVFVAGVGQHQMWSSQFLGHEKPNNWVQSAGLGTMGYAVPAAMGAKAGRQNNQVWCIDGDGCFQMTNQELATCRLNNLPIKVMIINNGTLGMPRQWQTLFFNAHYSQTDLHEGADGWSGETLHGDGEEISGGNMHIPDFVKLAEAYDCLALRVTTADEIDDALELAAKTNDRPVVIDFLVAKDAKVFPMVPAGRSNSEIMYKIGEQPLNGAQVAKAVGK
jgi:acetolactate synthase-1/2/3 large subunit